MQSFNNQTQSLVVAVVTKEDKQRIKSHPLRAGRSLDQFQAELILRGLNQPELRRLEETTRGEIPEGSYEVEIQSVTRLDAVREIFHVTLGVISGLFVGRTIAFSLKWPRYGDTRRGPHNHFNEAIGWQTDARLFGRELEAEGRLLRVKYWRVDTTEGGLEARVRFLGPLCSAA